MGIFSRVHDIISSNLNAMLDRAEDPEKMVKLMIREMEDTLIEIKASCAQAMATKKKVQRESDDMVQKAQEWADRSRLAVNKGREDLAREALLEKRRFLERVEVLNNELHQFDGIIDQYQQDIAQLEEKLEAAREKQRVLIQRHAHAAGKRKAQDNIRRMDNSDVLTRFEKFEQRIDRMEAEADLVNGMKKKPPVRDEFAAMETDDEIERELAALKNTLGK